MKFYEEMDKIYSQADVLNAAREQAHVSLNKAWTEYHAL